MPDLGQTFLPILSRFDFRSVLDILLVAFIFYLLLLLLKGTVAMTLFFPNSPLHDGAAIIRNGRIVAASCVLPLSEEIPRHAGLGTRHRAGVGVTEKSDA